MHHPLYRPIVLIIWLCAVIIGLNVLALWWLQARIPAPPVASTQADRTQNSVAPAPPTVALAPCEPTVAVNETQIAEQDRVIAQLEAEVERMKSARVGNGSEWRYKAKQLEEDLMELQQVAERVLEMPSQKWQVGKLMLAQALIKEKT